MQNSLRCLYLARCLCVAATMAATALAGCSRPPDLIGIDNPDAPAALVPHVSRHRMFIMTTREATEVVGEFYSARRAPNLGLASVDVTVPPNHVTGQLERPRHLPPDPRKEFAVIDPAVYQTDRSFIAAVNAELAKRPPGQRRLLLFVHGYNNTASDAVLRLAQFAEDTGFPGVPVLFSWASAARTPRYVYDLNSALVARVKLKEMAAILSATNGEGMDILAHSMGTFLTMEGLVDAQQAGTLNRAGRIDSIMLASPDIDIDLFRTQVSLLPPEILRMMYVLVSKDDSALRFSRIIAGGVPRVGAADATELERLGVTVIDLSDIANSGSGSHSKFASSPEVVQLIGIGLNTTSRFRDAETPGLTELLAGAPIRILGN